MLQFISVGTVYFLAQVLLSFAFCFFGYRHIRTLLSAYGFIAGFIAAYTLLMMKTSLESWAVLLLGVFGGAIVAGVSYFLYRTAMFLAGSGLGILAGFVLCSLMGVKPLDTLGLVIIGALAVAAGLLSIGYKKVILIASTAFGGATLLCLHAGYIIYMAGSKGLSGIASRLFPDLFHDMAAFFTAYRFYVFAAIIVFTAAGLLVQIKKPEKNY